VNGMEGMLGRQKAGGSGKASLLYGPSLCFILPLLPTAVSGSSKRHREWFEGVARYVRRASDRGGLHARAQGGNSP